VNWQVGERVRLKNQIYTVDGRKLWRRENDLPPREGSGTIAQLGEGKAVTRVVVDWDESVIRWVDCSCITVAPTEEEMKEVYRILGVDP